MTQRELVLLIDDEPDECALHKAGLERAGYAVRVSTSPKEALQHLDDVAVVITDLQMEEMNGLAVCERVQAAAPDIPVIMLTGLGSVDSAIAALRVGAYDFLTKPVDPKLLLVSCARAIERHRLRREVATLRAQTPVPSSTGRLGDSSPMRRVHDLIGRIAPSAASVLIHGETGTGKELVARAIHLASPRKDGPFIAINCAAVPPTLLESELFGHVRGAFTDAKKGRDGLFIQATAGTLFLDEIGELPLEMQPKLLRALQERMVRPVGGNVETQIDVRIIAATNRNLEEDVTSGRFREDLFYRINVVTIAVPSLRSRDNDILLLAQRFIDECSGRVGKKVVGLSSAAAKRLLDYDWPGNVRELENCMERAVTLTTFDRITLDDLPEKIRSYESSRLVIPDEDPTTMPTIEELERSYVHQVLKAVGGNKTHAAQVLGVDRRTLYRKLEKYASKKDSGAPMNRPASFPRATA